MSVVILPLMTKLTLLLVAFALSHPRLWLPCRLAMMFLLFISSRRRHTRCSRDWSSDVCSSDLRSASMIHVIAVITAKPGKRGAILEAFRANVPAVRAEKGCMEYGAAIDAENAPPIQAKDRKSVV